MRNSISFKLNGALFGRLIGIFTSLNFFLIVAVSVGIVYYAEKTADIAAKQVASQGLPEGETSAWLNFSGVQIEPLTAQKGFENNIFVKAFLPESTEKGKRNIHLNSVKGESVFKLFDNMTYEINLTSEENSNASYAIIINIGFIAHIFRYVLLALIIFEFISLIQNFWRTKRLVRKTLQPISELAAVAHTLNAPSNAHAEAYSIDQMKAMAGKLNNINASRLDTRIAVDSAQDELKTLAQAINSMLDRINDAYHSQIRFVSDASHELRTPISVIQGYASLLDRWGKNDEKTLQESIDAIKAEAAGMKDLVEQLLFLARGDNDTMALNLQRFDLADLVSEVLRETKMIDGGHEYSGAISSVFITADEALIKQTVRILMDNAIKYTPAGGNIKLSVSCQGDMAWLTVQDEGIGISANAVPKVMERFYRADDSRARKTGGTGLGLSIAKWITERHGGYMEIVSREDLGTRASIVLAAMDSDSLGNAEQTADTCEDKA